MLEGGKNVIPVLITYVVQISIPVFFARPCQYDKPAVGLVSSSSLRSILESTISMFLAGLFFSVLRPVTDFPHGHTPRPQVCPIHKGGDSLFEVFGALDLLNVNPELQL